MQEVRAVARRNDDAVLGKRRRLGTELRLLRDLKGVGGRELARRIGISQSKVSRIELGAALPSEAEVTAWAEAVGAPQETGRLLEKLTDAARTEVESWREALLGRPHHLQDDISEIEKAAWRTRGFQPCLVPGLLQTPDYAQRVLTAFKEDIPQLDVAAAVAGRMNRQLILYEEGKEFEFLITEGALRLRPGSPNLLLAQLDRIAQLSTKSNVSIGIIPLLENPATTLYTHGFTLIESNVEDEEDSPAVVFIENDHGGLIVRDPDDVDMYQRRWSRLRAMAKFDDEARAQLDKLSAQVRAVPE
jgi:transcriptional regulator with XRE-family HTH domain